MSTLTKHLFSRLVPHVRLTHSRVTVGKRGVFDGTNLVLHHESRYMCRCSECFGPTSNQPLHTNDYTEVRVTEVKEVQKHFITLGWDDGHVGILPRSQVGAYGNGYKATPPQRYYDLSLRKNSSQTFWDYPTPEVTQKFDYTKIVADPAQLKEFLAHYMEYGLALLTNAPCEPGDLIKILDALDVGPYWESLFGLLSRVEYQHDPVNQAFNNQHLSAHTDTPYYTQTPSVYFFHCVANELEGGESFWADTFSAVQHIRDKKPGMFTLLTTVLVPFRQYRVGWHMAGSYPTVELMGSDIYRVRDCSFVIDNYQFVQDYDAETRAAWWLAYNYLRARMTDPKRAVQVKLQPGDVAVIDNWRVQHGRNTFNVSGAEGKKRIMDTVYVEWNHVQNKLLKME